MNSTHHPSAREIGSFWDLHPVGADFIPEPELRSFFEAYDRRRHATEGHIRTQLAGLKLAGKRTLEIGLGQGTESQTLAQASQQYVGVDLSTESIRRVKLRFDLHGVRNAQLALMNGERLAFEDESFDVVFSHGVIHHSPRAAEIVAEIHRVLCPGGLAVVMVYHRNSLNYQVSIRVVRRLGIFALGIPGVARAVSTMTGEPLPRLVVHTENLRKLGWKYLRMDNFIHASTDGPHNVYSSVWSERDARELFSAFREVRCTRHHLNDRHLPFLRWLGAGARETVAARFGWHLWITARR